MDDPPRSILEMIGPDERDVVTISAYDRNGDPLFTFESRFSLLQEYHGYATDLVDQLDALLQAIEPAARPRHGMHVVK